MGKCPRKHHCLSRWLQDSLALNGSSLSKPRKTKTSATILSVDDEFFAIFSNQADRGSISTMITHAKFIAIGVVLLFACYLSVNWLTVFVLDGSNEPGRIGTIMMFLLFFTPILPHTLWVDSRGEMGWLTAP